MKMFQFIISDQDMHLTGYYINIIITGKIVLTFFLLTQQKLFILEKGLLKIDMDVK